MSSAATLDALGGSVAAAASVCIFYPLELIRVRMQTMKDDDRRRNLQARLQAVLVRTIKGFTERGVALRIIHTILTSFLYYRIYSWLARRTKKRTVISNIVSSNLSAMFTVILAMPLESSVLKSQVDSQADDGDRSPSTVSESGRGGDSSDDETGLVKLQKTLTYWYQGLTPALLLCLNPMIHYSVYDWLKLETLNWKKDNEINRAAQTRADQLKHTYRQSGIYSDNRHPIINRNKFTYEDLDNNQLETGEAFIIGVIAKAVATLITFPLLRAKVLMMTSTDVRDTLSDREEDKRKGERGIAHVSTFSNSLNAENDEDEETDEDHGAAGGGEKIRTRRRAKSISEYIRRSDVGKLLNTLKLLFRVQGISGLYVGVLVHLIHTTLRGAVSMTLKERLVLFLRSVGGQS